MTIIDRRQGQRNKLSGSRNKFINRYKRHLKDVINNHIQDKSIKEVGKEVKVRATNIKPAIPVYDKKNSIYKNVHPGNKKYVKGDVVHLPKSGGTAVGGGRGETTESEEFITFNLTKEEFLDLLFEDLALPNFLKKSDKYMSKVTKITGGYTKVGVPARLALKKTFENAIKRRLALKDTSIGKRFLDDIDIRYRDIIELKKPISHALMFCVLDVSASMTDKRRLIAKKFFLLLYLFLEKNYEYITMRFIAHTSEAFELEEELFFDCSATGGTVLSSPIRYINKIIDTEYDVDSVNIYVAHASDGENWSMDYEYLKEELDILLPKIQYLAYIEVDQEYSEAGATEFYSQYYRDVDKIGYAVIYNEADVYKALRELFTKGEK